MTTYPLAIEIQHLTRLYSTKKRGAAAIAANDDLSFQVYRGEIFGLLGANGAGKTTLVLQLLGLVKPTSGSIWLEGIDVVAHSAEVKRLTGFLPQTGIPMRYAHVEQALYYTGRLRGQTDRDARQQANQLVEQLGLSEYAHRDTNNLSGGMLRLTNFGMALMGHPHLLVLDEPTNELDPVKRRLVWDTISNLNRQEGMTCVLVTHNVSEAERVLHRVALMKAGKIIRLGLPSELKLEIGSSIWLEFEFRDGIDLSEEDTALVSPLGNVERLSLGHYRIALQSAQVAYATDVIVNHIGLANLEDFRLVPPSLEDVYLALDARAEKGTLAQKPSSTRISTRTLTLSAVVDPHHSPTDNPAVNTAQSADPLAARPIPRWKSFTDLKFLWLEHMLEIKATLVWFVVFSLGLPLILIFGIGHFGSGLTDRNSMLYLISGAAIYAVINDALAAIALRVGVMRSEGMLTYFASLPISKTTFVIALVLSRLVISLPGMIVAILFGPSIYHVSLNFNLWVIILLVLTGLSLSVIGMAMGLLVESLANLQIVNGIILTALTLVTPIFTPINVLPLPLQIVGYCFPPTYAADALRRSLDGNYDPTFYADIAILVGITIISFYILSHRLRWRV